MIGAVIIVLILTMFLAFLFFKLGEKLWDKVLNTTSKKLMYIILSLVSTFYLLMWLGQNWIVKYLD